MKSIFLLSSILSLNAFAINETIQCVFTEPFIGYEINKNGKVFYNDVVLDNKIEITDKVSFAGPYLNDKNLYSYQLLKLKDGELKNDMEISINMNGHDGMSDFASIYTATIKDFYGAGEDLQGACHTETAPRVLPPEPGNIVYEFYEDVQYDIKSCYRRVLSDWTHKKSKYKNQSVFSVLYSYDGQIYEANKAIDTLATAESEQLVELVKATKSVPKDNEGKDDLIKAALKVCDFYSGRLLDRIHRN